MYSYLYLHIHMYICKYVYIYIYIYIYIGNAQEIWEFWQRQKPPTDFNVVHPHPSMKVRDRYYSVIIAFYCICVKI
jgi:hypothetical protein